MRRDDGFTLVELLIALALGGMIVGVLATALTIGVQSYGAARDLLDVSARQQITTSRFVTDVQSAEQVRGSASCVGSGFVVGFTWNFGQEGDPEFAYAVDWALEGNELRRVVCGTGHTQTLLTDVLSVDATCAGTRCELSWSSSIAQPASITATRRITS